MTQHERCEVKVTVLGETDARDGGHKVKLVGLLLMGGGAGGNRASFGNNELRDVSVMRTDGKVFHY